jgi:hypothetical protein
MFNQCLIAFPFQCYIILPSRRYLVYMQLLFFRFRFCGGNLGINDLLNRAVNAIRSKESST